MDKKFDLNLLNTFDALWRERNVTRAARRLNVTQPAVSNALSRLRETFGDELFIRTPSGVDPTERCSEIAIDVREALRHVERTLASHDSFDPRVSERTFRIGAMDYYDHVVLPPLMETLREKAPRVDLRISPVKIGETYDSLDSGDLDFLFFSGAEPPKRINFSPMLEEKFVLIMREGHPNMCQEMTLEAYSELDHIVFSTRGDSHTRIDDLLAENGLRRRVALTSSHHTSIAETVRDTDMVALSPSRLAYRHVQRGGLVAVQPPVEFPHFNLRLYWSRRLNSDPGAMWLRNVLSDVCKNSPVYVPPTKDEVCAIPSAR
ncbi:LysR family transcriptional regulator [Hirschia maritima]|uniref:LysR family transcriptional regulator n=1 Tax=Hirschia maritima TaxID=1121961 RepID=UPI00037030D7|nr:LysR family transcriptional regulator [Hirschia maritima]